MDKSRFELAPCPRRPSCVSSQARSAAQRVDPLPMPLPADQALSLVRGIVSRWPRTRLAAVEERYLHFECRTVLGFCDDLELVVDEAAGCIQVRSASRIGYRDLGVNRRRVERLRQALIERMGEL